MQGALLENGLHLLFGQVLFGCVSHGFTEQPLFKSTAARPNLKPYAHEEMMNVVCAVLPVARLAPNCFTFAHVAVWAVILRALCIFRSWA